MPWVAEGNQREQPERRAELFERFRAALAAAGAKVADVEGSWDERRRRAVQAMGALLCPGPTPRARGTISGRWTTA